MSSLQLFSQSARVRRGLLRQFGFPRASSSAARSNLVAQLKSTCLILEGFFLNSATNAPQHARRHPKDKSKCQKRNLLLPSCERVRLCGHFLLLLLSILFLLLALFSTAIVIVFSFSLVYRVPSLSLLTSFPFFYVCRGKFLFLLYLSLGPFGSANYCCFLR